MRIGVDASCWINRRGYGRFARELLGALVDMDGENEYHFLVDFDPATAPPFPPRSSIVRVKSSVPAARAAAASGRRALRDMWAMGLVASRRRFDLFFFPSVYSYFPILFGGAKIVMVIHDVIAERYPEHIFPNPWAARLWTLKLFLARRQADLIVTVSEASRKGIAEEFGIPQWRIPVIPEAADPRFRPIEDPDVIRRTLAKWGLVPGRVLLYVGGISPHKNLQALLEVFAALRKNPAFGDCRLVLAGDYQSDVFYSSYQSLERRVRQLGLDGAVVFTGYVTDAELVHLYNGATCLVFPSLCEGFGLPVLEAMACGTPVVASRNGSVPEVLGSAGVLWDPARPTELRAALERLLSNPDLRASLRRQGLERAGEFSWEKSARRARELFSELMKRETVRPRPAQVGGGSTREGAR